MKIASFATKDGKQKWAVMDAEENEDVVGKEPLQLCDSEEEAQAWMKANPKKKTDGKMRTGVSHVDTAAAGTLRKPVKMRNGWLRVDGHLTRTGVFEYRNQDGTPRRELRLPEDVFHQDSLESFSMVPITDDHPPKFLDSKNTGEYQRGHIGESVVRDGKLMRASMLITAAELVAKIEAGKSVEISNGYTCDLEERSGVTDDGEKYDCIQRNIVANHVAIVSLGRAGPSARVRMDSGADVLLSISGDGTSPPPQPAPPEKQPVHKIMIAGVEYEAGSAQAAAAQAALQTKLDAAQAKFDAAEKSRVDAEAKHELELKASKDAGDKLKARADAAEEAATKTAIELKAAPAKITAALKARQALEASAKSVLGPKVAKKFDTMEDKEIKLAVLKETNPDAMLDGKSDAYIDARFDQAIETFDAESEDGEEEEDGVTAARRGVKQDEEDGDDEHEVGDPAAEMTDEEANEPHVDSATAQAAMEQRHRNAWKAKIGVSV